MCTVYAAHADRKNFFTATPIVVKVVPKITLTARFLKRFENSKKQKNNVVQKQDGNFYQEITEAIFVAPRQ